MVNKSKPLLFIDTVQTEMGKNTGQLVYDSRKKQKVEKEIVKDEFKKEEEKVETSKYEIEKNTITDNEDIEKPNKLMHQINLLDKRAKQEHYVYIEVIVNKESYIGFFKCLNENCIVLSEENHERELEITTIEAIKILKV